MFSITISISLDGPQYRAIGTVNTFPRIMRGWELACKQFPTITADIRLKDIINGTT